MPQLVDQETRSVEQTSLKPQSEPKAWLLASPTRMDPQPGPRLGSYAIFLSLTVLAYVAIYASLLIKTDGFPFVTDNNESFSSLWHAHNLYTYDFSQSWGLTDEACSKAPDAHPFVHTHQGNFPRLFALLIYLFGATTITSQIAVTTFTIGLLSVWMAYHFFAVRANPAAAFCVVLFLMTDYVFFVQWQVVTYRVWHGFFIFSSLLTTHYAATGKKWWRFLTFANYACLYYFEAVFIIFVTSVCFVYAMTLYWGKWQTVRRLALTATLGGGVSVCILLAQLMAYMGPKDTWKDIYYTIKARQYTEPGTVEAAEVLGFYQNRKIVFFDNFASGQTLLEPRFFLNAAAYFHLGPYTPLVVVPVFLLVGAVMLRSLFSRLESRRALEATEIQDGWLHRAFGWACALAAIAAAAFFLRAALIFFLQVTGFAGLSPATHPQTIVLLAVGLGALAFFASSACFARAGGPYKNWRTLAAALLLVASVFLLRKISFYLVPVYGELLASPWLRALVPLAMTCFVAVALAVLRHSRTEEMEQENRAAFGHAIMVFSALAGFVLVSTLLGGYVLTWDPLESTCRHASLSIL